ncbi:MAG: hypothetical protein ACYC8T_09650 [Myxococcaceae bacterium]
MTDKLGERLRSQSVPDPANLDALQRVRAEYDAPLAKVEAILREQLGLKATSRIKTINTIVDKLRREKTRLSSMQDIAGLRIVEDISLSEQDALVHKICGALPKARVVDRRAKPSHGYRAVHVIAIVDERPVEIQVRTRLQDLWAQTIERLADRIGREIRYGQVPGAVKDDAEASAIQDLVEVLLVSSEQIAELEVGADQLRTMAQEIPDFESDLDRRLAVAPDVNAKAQRERLRGLKESAVRLESRLVGEKDRMRLFLATVIQKMGNVSK